MKAFRFSIAILLLVCGCSGKVMAPVHGKVTLPDGKPLVDGTVAFDDVANNLSASGTTDSQGVYSLSTFEPGDGVPPGTYQVSVSQPYAADSSQGSLPRMFPARYENLRDSGLKFTVQPGDNVFNIALEAK